VLDTSFDLTHLYIHQKHYSNLSPILYGHILIRFVMKMFNLPFDLSK
jgi:hypothetical protein